MNVMLTAEEDADAEAESAVSEPPQVVAEGEGAENSDGDTPAVDSSHLYARGLAPFEI